MSQAVYDLLILFLTVEAYFVGFVLLNIALSFILAFMFYELIFQSYE